MLNSMRIKTKTLLEKKGGNRDIMALKNVNIPLNIKDFPSSTAISNCAYIGENNEIANADNILIIGNNINWKGHGGPQSNTLVVGENLTSQSGAFDNYKNQVVIGEFNEPSSTQGSYLVVGDGTGKNELAHNILVVKKGQVNINGSLNINGSTGSSVTINAPINSDIALVNSSICFDDNNGPTIYGSSSSKYLSLTSPNGSINLNISQEQADPNIRLSGKGTDITGNTSISGNLTISNDATISGNLTASNDVTIGGDLKLKSKYLVYNNGFNDINYDFPPTGGTLSKLLYKYNVKLRFSNSAREYYLNLTLITSSDNLFNEYLNSSYYVDLTDSDNREQEYIGVLHSIMSYLTGSSSSDNTAYMDSYGSYIYDHALLGIYGFKISKASASTGEGSYSMSMITGADKSENIINIPLKGGVVNYYNFKPTGDSSTLKYFAIIKEKLN